MMTVYLNEKAIILSKEYSLTEFLNEHGYSQGPFAVTLNRQFVSRANYATKQLLTGDVIDIIMPMQGG